MKNSLFWGVLCATVLALSPMDMIDSKGTCGVIRNESGLLSTSLIVNADIDSPYAQYMKKIKREDKGELIFKKESKMSGNPINCIAFLDDANLMVGRLTDSMIIEVVKNDHRIFYFNFLPANHIVSYPEQKLIVVTGPRGVGIYEVCLDGEKNINKKSIKKNTYKGFFSGKAFLMCGGKNLAVTKGGAIKIYSCKNNKIGKSLFSQYAPYVPLCASSDFSSDSLFHYKAHTRESFNSWISEIKICDKKIVSKTNSIFPAPYTHPDVTRLVVSPAQKIIAFFVRGNCVIINEENNFSNLKGSHERWHSTATFYTDSILACLTFRKRPIDKNCRVRIQFHDIITQDIVFSRIVTVDDSGQIECNPTEIVFSPDRSKYAVVWNNQIFIYTVPIQLWKKTPQFRIFFIPRMSMIMSMIDYIALPNELLSCIKRFLWLSIDPQHG